jgi:hypothetical protein
MIRTSSLAPKTKNNVPEHRPAKRKQAIFQT